MQTKNTDTEGPRSAPRGLVLLAFAAIYLIWGSTYLGIRFAVETIPPFLLGGARFLAAGAILYAWLRFKGVPSPSGFHWRNAAIVGCLLLGVGNGGVNWAEQKVASSLAALLIAITPLWFVLLDWLRPRGTRPGFQTVLGIVVGFAGVALLVGGPDVMRRHAAALPGVAALMLASIAWASGSLCGRFADWFHCVQLVAQGEHAGTHFNVRLRESGDRGVAGVGPGRRRTDRAYSLGRCGHCFGRGHHFHAEVTAGPD